MATDRDQSELTFEGMTARVGRFLSRVYRFPHDWGVPEPKPTDDDNAFLRKRLEELRIYGCSPVPDWMKRKREASHASGQPTTVIPEAPKVLSGTQQNPDDNISGSRVSARDDKNGGSPHPHEQGEGAGDPSRRRGNITEQLQQKRPRLFRYDAKRLKRLISSAEHMIRCLIIWRAYRAMRDEVIKPRYHFIPKRMLDCCSSASGSGQSAPSRCSCALHLDACACGAALSATHREGAAEAGGQNKKHPPHPNFAVRGLPLYEPKAPPFRISMPMEVDRSSLRRQGSRRYEPDSRLRGNERNLEWDGSPERVVCETRFRENKGKRPRNDDLSTHERLYLRLERLDQLYEDIDKRGRRLAARWAGEIYGPDVRDQSPTVIPEGLKGLSGTQENSSSFISGSRVYARDDKEGGSSHPTTALSATHREAPDPIRGEAGGQTKMLADALSRRRRNASSIRPLKSHDPPSDLLDTTDEDEAEDLHILHDVAIRTAGEFHLLCG